MTRGWKLIIALAAVTGVGTCIALAFLWAALFLPQPGTLQVLDRAASDRDVLTGDYGSLESDVQMENARFLGTYENSDYFAAPSAHDETDFCLVTVAVIEDGGWEAACGTLIDGRDVLTYVWDPQGRQAMLVPDQFDNEMLEADGWVSVHKNLLIHPEPDAPAPYEDDGGDDGSLLPFRA